VHYPDRKLWALRHGRRNKIHFICRPIIFPFGELPRLSPATPLDFGGLPARSAAEVVKNTTVWLWYLPKDTEVPWLAFPGQTGAQFSWHMTLWMWGPKQRHLVWRNPFWHFPGKLPDNCYVHSWLSTQKSITRGFKFGSALRSIGRSTPLEIEPFSADLQLCLGMVIKSFIPGHLIIFATKLALFMNGDPEIIERRALLGIIIH